MEIILIILRRATKISKLKVQCRLDIRKYSFSQRTINEWNKLLNIDEKMWTLDKPVASLSTCHLRLRHLGLWLCLGLDGNLVKSCYIVTGAVFDPRQFLIH